MEKRQSRLTLLGNAAAVISTLVAAVAGLAYVRHAERTGADIVGVRTVADWQVYSNGGDRLGPEAASVRITVFSDYTCPHCRLAAETLREILRDDEQVAVVFRHFPTSDGVPRDAALAAVCGQRAGRFEALHYRLFDQADSLGQKAWGRYALDAGITDTTSFRNCMSDSTAMVTIARGLREAYRLGVSMTPAFLVNEKFFEGNPPRGFLESLVRDSR